MERLFQQPPRPLDAQCAVLRRQAVQAERSRPLVEALFAWLGAQFARLPGSSPTAVAIRYTSDHRNGLVRFLDDGRIEADTNAVNEERSASREHPSLAP